MLPLALPRESIATPLKKMREAMLKVAESGRFDIRLDVTSQDEIGQSATAFNALLSNLQKTIEAISRVMEALAQGQLDPCLDPCLDAVLLPPPLASDAWSRPGPTAGQASGQIAVLWR